MDVLIDGETVVALLAPGSTSLAATWPRPPTRVIDATGKYVVPGGVDCHTHMELPFGGTFASDTFESGTTAAAWGGTTTIVDFAVQSARRTRAGRPGRLARARRDGKCAIDYAFHQIIGGVDDESLKAMDELIDEGITSFKLFMAYPGVFYSDDGQILRAMQTAANNGAMIMMHAENGTAIDVLVKQALARGETAPINHGLTRPVGDRGGGHAPRDHAGPPHRRAAVRRAHVGQAGGRHACRAQRDKGWNVFGETCPQYLYLSLEEQLGAPGFEGAKWVCSTPLRARAEGHQESCGRTCAPTTCRS